MSTIINTRSPYFIKESAQAGTMTSATFEIKIWDGIKTNPPTAVTYTITKTPLEISTGNFVVLEVSELIRDYLQTEYYTEAVDAVWVNIANTITFSGGSQTTGNDTYLAIDGFGYFEDGINPRTSTDPTASSFTPMVLQSNLCVQFVKGRDIKIPIFSEAEPTITTTATANNQWDVVAEFWEQVASNWDSTGTTQNVVDSDDSDDKIQYIIISSNNLITGNTITVTSTTGPAQTQVITLEEICETRFDPIRSIFYNKFGALQTMWLTKKSTTETKVKSEEFKRNTVDFSGNPAYSVFKHNKKRFNVKANQSIETNTTLLNECLNEPIEQLLMSEQVWLEDGALNTAPVNLKTQSLKRKIGVNDKVNIQYTLNFDYAFDKINSVR
tara:strand:+ start:4315 stop:5466 length:1152 start_codon:yes stop_codon:yes gene_type:complete